MVGSTVVGGVGGGGVGGANLVVKTFYLVVMDYGTPSLAPARGVRLPGFCVSERASDAAVSSVS